MYLNEILPGNWREDKWPEHIEVSHEASRFKSRRYVPRVNSANKSSANPVDGIWCSHCGWAGVIAQDMTIWMRTRNHDSIPWLRTCPASARSAARFSCIRAEAQ